MNSWLVLGLALTPNLGLIWWACRYVEWIDGPRPMRCSPLADVWQLAEAA
ncbi:MAG: hypothetical protein ACRDUT_21125 [Mycobacterium sp.]